MEKGFFLFLLFVIIVSININASNERIGIGFSFDLSYISKPHLILSLEGDLDNNFTYQISKDFLDEKDAKLMVGKFWGEEYESRSCLYAGIKYEDLSSHEFFFRYESYGQELLVEKLFSFSNEELIDNFILEHYIPSHDGNLQIETIYYPKGENYFIKYIFLD